MKFADIPGLEEEKKRLIDFFKRDKIHHALLFFGLEGSRIGGSKNFVQISSTIFLV